jgi:Flp pilus assembly protein CpaB
MRGRQVEIIAGAVLLLFGAAGLLVWARWGLLVAFDAVVRYCF